MFCAKGGNTFRVVVRTPKLKVGLERPEKRTHRLPHRVDEVSRTAIQMLLGAQESLTEAKASSHCGEGHTHLGAHSARCVVPHLLFQKMTAKPTGECELDCEWFPDALGIQSPGHRIDEVAQKQSIEFMPAVKWSDQI